MAETLCYWERLRWPGLRRNERRASRVRIDVTPEELLDFADVPMAIFGPEADLIAVNAAFGKAFPRMMSHTLPGTPWGMLLSEAVRQNLMSFEDKKRLLFLEENLSTDNAMAQTLDVDTGIGPLRLSLKAASTGGFALKLDRGPTRPLEADGELEHLLARVLEACPTCLTMSRIGDGQILYRSPEATALLGKGFNSREHFALREERADFITGILPNSRIDDMRITARRADGTPFQASISARLIDYRGEDVIVSSIVDLTDELKMRDELDRQRQQVFRSEKMSALGEVLAGIAHELNNPLSIIVGNAQLLAEDGIDGPPGKRVDKVAAAAERCVSIVRTFLSMARDRPLQLEEIAPRTLLETAREAFEAGDLGRTDVTLQVDPDLPCLLADEVQLVQVLTNLMTNAEQALAGQADARIDLRATKLPDENMVRLTVSDNGPGISESVAKRIFDPLFTTKAAGKGTGIGLALCNRIVLAHSGTIELDRDAAKGATFLVDLPALSTDPLRA
ncbi:MAG: ATP-binding protein [Pseudomonadota bacterium]